MMQAKSTTQVRDIAQAKEIKGKFDVEQIPRQMIKGRQKDGS